MGEEETGVGAAEDGGGAAEIMSTHQGEAPEAADAQEQRKRLGPPMGLDESQGWGPAGGSAPGASLGGRGPLWLGKGSEKDGLAGVFSLSTSSSRCSSAFPSSSSGQIPGAGGGQELPAPSVLLHELELQGSSHPT